MACTSTWALLRGAGNDPLHQAAFHQRFAREPRSLPLGTVRLFTLIRIFSFGVRHHAAIHRLLILLKGIRNTPKMAALTTFRSPFVEIIRSAIFYTRPGIFSSTLEDTGAWLMCSDSYESSAGEGLSFRGLKNQSIQRSIFGKTVLNLALSSTFLGP